LNESKHNQFYGRYRYRNITATFVLELVSRIITLLWRGAANNSCFDRRTAESIEQLWRVGVDRYKER